MADSRGKLRFKATEVRRIDDQLRDAHDRLSACGIASGVFIAPNKQSIYGEFLIPGKAPPSRLDALLSELSDPARDMIIDPRGMMREAKRAHAPMRLYNKTETHWNDLGAYYGYVAIMRRIAQTVRLANPELVALDNYHIIAGPYPGGDMATRVLFSPWRFADVDVSLSPKVPHPGLAQTQINRIHFVARNPRGKGRLILFGDSFGTYLVPFLAQHFEEVHRYVGEEFNGALIGIHHPDVVLLETLESYAPRLLLPPVALAAACKDPRATM
jgi:hypothetical protein